MRVKRTIKLTCSYETAVAAVRKSSLLHYVTSPLVVFSPHGGTFPEEWTPGTHFADLKLFGFIPFGKQAIVISFETAQYKFIMHDKGYSAIINKWNHTIKIEPLLEGGSRYTDEIEVEAGLITPFIWIFAHIFYKHRQKRWLKLCTKNFHPIQ